MRDVPKFLVVSKKLGGNICGLSLFFVFNDDRSFSCVIGDDLDDWHRFFFVFFVFFLSTRRGTAVCSGAICRESHLGFLDLKNSLDDFQLPVIVGLVDVWTPVLWT
jgi:hypothetical protein